MFPGIAEYEKDGKTAKTIGPVKKAATFNRCSSICGCKANGRGPRARPSRHGDGLRFGPGPDITLDNALWQLDRVARRMGEETGNAHEKELHDQIEQLVRNKSHAPLGGLVGVPL